MRYACNYEKREREKRLQPFRWAFDLLFMPGNELMEHDSLDVRMNIPFRTSYID